MKVDSLKVREAIESSSNVIIMAHSDLDLDALGACLGLFYISSYFDKMAYIVIDDKKSEQGVRRAIDKINDLEYTVEIIKSSNLDEIIKDDSLLIIVDTNNINRLQSKEVFNKIRNKIIIDHHIKNYNVDNLVYEYINDLESSTCEIIIDIINDLNLYIPDYIATVMLAGIFVDTNNFSLKVSKYTFDIADKLMSFDASITEVQYLLKQDYNKYVERQKIIFDMVFVNGDIGISLADENKIYEDEELAKAADTILIFNNVEASFVIGKTSEEVIAISSRSFGKYDVQKIMKYLNGGGHKTDAAAQINSKDMNEVRNRLLDAIDKVLKQ